MATIVSGAKKLTVSLDDQRGLLSELMFDDELFRLKRDKCVDFYACPLVPEKNLEIKNTRIPSIGMREILFFIVMPDPDHNLKKLIPHIVGQGFMAISPKYFLDILPECNKNKDIPFGSWWYTRKDTQNVSEAKVPFCKEVECIFEERGWNEASMQVRIFREFYEAFDKSGITDADRVTRVWTLLKLIEPHLIESMFDGRGRRGKFGGATFPRQAANFDEDSIEWSGHIPRDCLEEVIMMAYGYLYLEQMLARLRKNKEYISGLEDAEPALPLFIARFASSMDLETWFMNLNHITGRMGKYQASRATAKDILGSVHKLLYTQNVENKARTFANTSYKRVEFNKTHEQKLSWNHPVEGKVSKGEKRGTHVKNKNALNMDEMIVTTGNTFVRDHYV
jgi:hypothetical protein